MESEHKESDSSNAGVPRILTSELAAYLASVGLLVREVRINERYQRVACGCGAKGKPGWYSATLLRSSIVCYHGCWRCAPKSNRWISGNGILSADEVEELRQEQELRARKAEAERERIAVITERTLTNLRPCPADHPYLQAKRVQPHGALVCHDKRNRHLQPPILVLPLRDAAGKTWSCQYIDERGEKLFETGGRTEGCFHILGALLTEGRVIICEGFATGASLHEATGISVVCAMNAGNLSAVAQALHKLSPEVSLLVAGDDDWRTTDHADNPMNPGRDAAKEAADAVGCRWVLPAFPANRGEKDTDFNDLARLADLAEVKRQIDAAFTSGGDAVVAHEPHDGSAGVVYDVTATDKATPTLLATPLAILAPEPSATTDSAQKEADESVFARLAALSPAEYDRQRDAEADRLGIRVSTLDAEVARWRATFGSYAGQGSDVEFEDVEPWPHPVDGPDAFDALAAIFRRYIALPAGAADALALWTATTHVFEVFIHAPRLNLCSPEKGCGKTLVLDVLGSVVARPLRTESITPAVLFRLVEMHRPTLLLDELDTYLNGNEELRGLLNAGHKRGAKAYRCEGDGNAVREFSAFAPAALAGIGALPGTLHDRSIVIRLVRAKPGEVGARLDSRRTAAESELRRKLARWAADNRTRLEACDPTMPAGAFNRLADNWRPLFAIAEVTGGEWPTRAHNAFVALTASDDPDAQGVGAALLADLRTMFTQSGTDRLPSAAIAQALGEMDGRPWPEFRDRKPITVNQLARLLVKFGVHSRTIRVGNVTAKGYFRTDFEDAFDRYLPPPPSSKRNSVTTIENKGDFPLLERSHTQTVLRIENPVSPNKDAGCYAVTLPEPPEGVEPTDLEESWPDGSPVGEAPADHAGLDAEGDATQVLTGHDQEVLRV